MTDPIGRDESDPERPLVPEDDAIIGRALRWSAAAVVVLGIGVVGSWIWLHRDAGQEPVRAKEVGTVPDLAGAADQMPNVHFTDVTEAVGIRFVHGNGGRGNKLLPETMGSGVAFLDYDEDDDEDLLFVDSGAGPGDRSPAGGSGLALYRNDGGRFTDATSAAGLNIPFYGMGVAVADYDGDGDRDLFVTALGPNHLFRNDGDRFTEVTSAAGVAGAADTWSSSAGFVDYDRDGDLDLFVCNYVRWTRAIDMELNFTLNGRDRAYGPPTNYEGSWSELFRNEGNGRFTDVSAAAGIRVDNPLNGRPMGKALALAIADADGDGWPDIFVANDTVQNFLFHNKRDGTFEEIGAVAGVGFDGSGNATGAMGIDAAFYRNDDQLAVAIGNFANEMTSFYVAQNRDMRFTDEAVGEGVGAPSRLFLTFGLFFFDYDLDGRLDLLQSNGHLESEIQQVQASQTYRQPAQLFWNAGPTSRSCYSEVPRDRTGDLSRPIVGRGAAYSDFDGDGDLDVVLTANNDRPLLLRNDQALGHHWLRVRLVGTGANRDAIGAWVELTAAGIRQRKQVMPTCSYLSQVELSLTFGLGRSERIDSIRVIWPDGVEQTVEPGPVDREVVVRRMTA